jgi:hypothetical protein
MLGVFAQAASEYITADAIELSDAGWFDRPTVKAALARSTSKESPVLQAYDGGSGACAYMHACSHCSIHFNSTLYICSRYYIAVHRDMCCSVFQ